MTGEDWGARSQGMLATKTKDGTNAIFVVVDGLCLDASCKRAVWMLHETFGIIFQAIGTRSNAYLALGFKRKI